MNLKISILILSVLFIASCSNKSKKSETVPTEEKIVEITPETALQSYLNNDDKTNNQYH